MKHLPAWFYESDVERCVWMSQVMQKLWLSVVSGMTEKIVMTSVQPQTHTPKHTYTHTNTHTHTHR